MSIPAPDFDSAALSLPLPHPEAYAGEPREYARALMQRKEEIEKEIDRLKDVLATHGASADTALVDPEGYPRGDIDIYSIRHARAALVRLYNDRAEVMRRLASALESAFEVDPNAPAPAPSRPPPNASANTNANGYREGGGIPDAWPAAPIARVNSVAATSPAADAGLEAGDIIYSFSGITAPAGIQAIGAVVQRSEGQSLTLLVLRGAERKMLRLTPRTWSGRGLLGCHILPA
ncbi:hypothetical protein CC85DRAFT_135051 [Cutaneotrichosporon oleaginosum]|uniref:Probable 26S proteasome regulatory subunit p27 n=1 Tax=Cutaneotrichosporon oleaginosum TaxID=879819 RepID=A0A0J0XWK4_9TREE|nr:uncharacterized protein CC85DRAFT_135051 [Cutaneotrichosporon oleaginosum]KLT45445.1 hypothetical protein CC85DRAFT_135051 [Cutaneotrichosporon oleaginosum]TXT14595.1 hypothetical protein COLE_00788 [Cutaneotrichosporon oleaginosum]